MEIDANLNTGPVNGLTPTPRPSIGPGPAAETDSFTSSAALQNVLKNTTDVRADAVARGRALVSNDGYPSDEQLKTLSGFLADRLQSSQD
jgi:hypothetical protein